jgi:hypothetical protein
MKTIEFNNIKYPFWETNGNAAKFIIPLQKKYAKVLDMI